LAMPAKPPITHTSPNPFRVRSSSRAEAPGNMLLVQHRTTLRYLPILPRAHLRCATGAGLRTAGFTPWMIAWFGPVIDPGGQVMIILVMPNLEHFADSGFAPVSRVMTNRLQHPAG